MKAKYTALDIANIYVDLANNYPNETIDNLKLNKLCYYAQGWAIARLGYPLFSDKIEAWKYGPAIQSVYHAYKSFENSPITAPTYRFDESLLTSDEISLLIDVYNTYGKFTSGSLIAKTHQKGTPWDMVFEESKNNEIKLKLLREYFAASDELETFKPNITEKTVVSYA